MTSLESCFKYVSRMTSLESCFNRATEVRASRLVGVPKREASFVRSLGPHFFDKDPNYQNRIRAREDKILFLASFDNGGPLDSLLPLQRDGPV